jgi:hypothetical protein
MRKTLYTALFMNGLNTRISCVLRSVCFIIFNRFTIALRSGKLIIRVSHDAQHGIDKDILEIWTVLPEKKKEETSDRTHAVELCILTPTQSSLI